ncbi:ABC transporter substrate-binding protein [Desulfolutivibrio sulfoxidireducens]|uniref:ABC transporter substrate-binding protein n=1 Tax=Desulfolutivibrio sulfoxidireducens TaxID=2773299 RepID=UPI00159D5026|nr:ABC transporter substrate-binding protein [Desulfolutivibrio sulfoxidireducens]QLA17945.1 transporter substrate-binding domain-containing protein [Desulfolutivibrio sulfoxidireducens]QLA21522.1 transporter substrate-binding domain-containing protein [Desulfolutivibrio sulfoxidireducens]
MRKTVLFLALAAMLVLAASPALAGKVDDVKARGTLIAGVKDSQPPFGFVDEKTNQIAGFEIDICKALADRLGVKLETKPVTSSTRIPMLTQGAIDIVAATMTHQKGREDQVDFSITYFMTGQKLLVKKDGGIKGVKDLAGKKVGSVKGSTSEQNVKKAQPECTVISFETYPEAFLALKQGKVEAVTTDESILVGLQNSDDKPGDFAIVGEYISPEPYGLGVAENDSDFRDFVNLALMDMWASGEYQKIYEKWFGKDTKFFIPLEWKMEMWP